MPIKMYLNIIEIQKVELEFWEYFYDRIIVTLQRASKKKLKVISATYPYNFDEMEVSCCDLTQGKLFY